MTELIVKIFFIFVLTAMIGYNRWLIERNANEIDRLKRKLDEEK